MVATLSSHFAERLEGRLQVLLPDPNTPPEDLHRAMHHAVFLGGKRIRPRLLLTVALSCLADEMGLELALLAACSVELVHAASLVHDDLPCFDDASLRRGRPTVHKAFGESMAVLAGDALLSCAFTALSDAPQHLATRALLILNRLGKAVGSREGIIGGQSLEQHPDIGAGTSRSLMARMLGRYHAMKTAALFRFAAEAGALAAGVSPVPWGEVGECLGLAYQLADDLYDTKSGAYDSGKPVGRDAALGRPNAVLSFGLQHTRDWLSECIEQAIVRTHALAVDTRPISLFIEEIAVCLTSAPQR